MQDDASEEEVKAFVISEAKGGRLGVDPPASALALEGGDGGVELSEQLVEGGFNGVGWGAGVAGVHAHMQLVLEWVGDLIAGEAHMLVL